MKISKWVLLWAAACFVIGCNDDSGTKDDDVGQSQTCKAEGQVKCGDGCIDPKTDKEYCGADENCEKYMACGENQTCESGKMQG